MTRAVLAIAAALAFSCAKRVDESTTLHFTVAEGSACAFSTVIFRDSECQTYSLPVTLIYDARGMLITGMHGYRPQSSAAAHAAAIRGERAFFDYVKNGEPARISTTEEELRSLLSPEDQATLEEEVTEGRYDAAYVLFGAEWCTPCDLLEAEFPAIEAAAPGKRILFVKIDADYRGLFPGFEAPPS